MQKKSKKKPSTRVRTVVPSVPLKYVFTAQFENNEFYEQTPDDKSKLFPAKAKKTCFSDVLKLIEDGKKLVAFHLMKVDSDKEAISVNLLDGSFMINGILFRLYDKLIDESKLTDFRVVYFRNVNQHLHMNTSTGERSYSTDISYLIGWQANDPKGKNIPKFIEIF